jgi:hypothetical protein
MPAGTGVVPPESFAPPASQDDDSMLDAMEVEALKEVGSSTGLSGFGAAVTSVGLLLYCHWRLLVRTVICA